MNIAFNKKTHIGREYRRLFRKLYEEKYAPKSVWEKYGHLKGFINKMSYNKDYSYGYWEDYWVFRGGSVHDVINELSKVIKVDGITHPPSMWDCTGRISTSPVELVHACNERIILKQSMSRDI